MKTLLPILCGLLLACSRQAPAPAGAPDASVPAAPQKEAPAPVATGTPPEAPRDAGAGAARCSASTLSPEPKPAQPPLPEKAEAMRRRIIAAAVACDYETLTALSVEEGKEFNAGSGETDLATFWRKQEQQGEPVLARLVRILNLPYSGEGEHYLWPSAAGMFRKAKDWEAIEGLYPPETIAKWKGTERGYTGLRTGIHLNGDWLFAMSGE